MPVATSVTVNKLGGFLETRQRIISTGLKLHLGGIEIFRGRYGDPVVMAMAPKWAYLGRIDSNGDFWPSKEAREMPAAAKRHLWHNMTKLRLALDKFLKEYGNATGVCACCGATLTNDESKARGVGPVCAGKYMRGGNGKT